MATTASNEVIPGFGMGLITYLCDEVGTAFEARRDGWKNRWTTWRDSRSAPSCTCA